MSTKTAKELERLLKAMRQADRSGNQDALIRHYEKYLKLAPDHLEARAEAASLYLQRSQIDQAMPHIQKVLESDSGAPSEQADQHLFPALAKHDHFREELAQAEAWYTQNPNIWRLQLLAPALMKAERFIQAEHLLCKYLETQQEPPLQRWLLSMASECYRAMRRFPEAIACAQLQLEDQPENRDALIQLGKNQEQQGNYTQAFEAYCKILEVNANDPDAHRYLASMMLKLGNFAEGWKHWEWRWAKSLSKQVQNFPIQEWQGSPLDGKTLIVWAEQGIGDEVMFASLMKDLREKTQGSTIYYVCDKRLIPAFTRMCPDIQFIANTHALVKRWPQADFHIPLGSLCKILRPDLASFGDGRAYLSPPRERSNELRNKYAGLFGGKKLIGVSWRGGSAGTNKFSRSLTLDELAALGKLRNIQLINLQYGETEKDRQQLNNKYEISLYHDESINPLTSIEDQAAQISALDLVISIDNTTVHLAGALGTPTYALLPLDPDWRWGLDIEHSYWYNSVLLIRNTRPDSWEPAIEDVLKKIQP